MTTTTFAAASPSLADLTTERLEAQIEDRLEAERPTATADGVAARRELLGAVLAFSHVVLPTIAE